MTDSPNVVMVVLDTLRKDVLWTYGGRGKSPSLDAVAADGVVFRHAVASSPWTTPSHASLFTGLLPSRHGVHEGRTRKITDIFGDMANAQFETLASYLSERGYSTACFTANANISRGSGFERGFDSCELMYGPVPDEKTVKAVERARKYGKTRGEIAKNMLKKGKVGELYSLYSEDRRLKSVNSRRNYPLFKGGDMIADAIAAKKLEEPFFLFVNLLEMHEPYLSGAPGGEPKPVADLFGKQVIGDSTMQAIRGKYMEELTAVDSFLGRIVRWLKDGAKYDDSLLVVTSDHGQALKERGFYGHGTFMHDEILKIPLVVKYPQNRKDRQAEGYQPLHRVPELVKDCLVGVYSGESLSSGHAVSESFGIPNRLETVEDSPGFEEKRERFDRARKAVYGGGMKLVVDGKDGVVEEFSSQGKPLDQKENREKLRDLLLVLRSVGDSEFILPS